MTDTDERTEELARKAGAVLRAESHDAAALERLLARVRTEDFEEERTRERESAREKKRESEKARKLRWFSTPMLVAAAATLVIGVGIGRLWEANLQQASLGAGRMAAGTTATLRPVQFVYAAPDARAVSLVGDFNNWNPGETPMHRSADGREWSASLALPAGLHVYSFIVNDSTWVTDPQAPLAPDAGYGARTSVLLVADRSDH